MIALEIRNDGTGDVVTGRYDVRVALPGVGWVEARVEPFDRWRGWAELVRESVTALEETATGGSR